MIIQDHKNSYQDECDNYRTNLHNSIQPLADRNEKEKGGMGR